MKIKIIKDFRNQKAGWEYDFSDLKELKYMVIVGDNGSGKSTIMQALRGTTSKKTNSLYEDDYKKLAENIEVEHNYENIVFFDAVNDNGLNFMNAFDASNYVSMGGYAKQKISHGQGALNDLGLFLEKNKNSINEKTLVVLDEVDNGLSTANMAKFFNFISTLSYTKKCDIIAISHNPFLIARSIICYNIEKREIVNSKKYIKEVTGYEIKMAKEEE